MLIQVNGVSERDQIAVTKIIVGCMEAYGISYPLWTFKWGGPVQVTDGRTILEPNIVVGLPGTEAIRAGVDKGLLEDMSRELGGAVYVVMAPIEVSFNGNRL